MFEISRIFHLTHVVHDLDGAVQWYDDVFAAQRLGHATAGPTGAQICHVLVADLDRAADHLTGKGMRTERPTAHALTVDPDDSHGLLVRFTDRPVTAW